ncbi:MAG: hypothetical protein WKG07_19985 [Hymenobacter sp.]
MMTEKLLAWLRLTAAHPQAVPRLRQPGPRGGAGPRLPAEPAAARAFN